jgi:hypothetical protein
MNRRAVNCGGESASRATADALNESPHSVAAIAARARLEGLSSRFSVHGSRFVFKFGSGSAFRVGSRCRRPLNVELKNAELRIQNRT